MSVTIIDKHRDRRLQPCRAHNQIDKVIAVHVPRCNFQTTNRPIHPDRLPHARAHPEADPVARVRRSDQSGFYSCEVGSAVAVEIRDRKMSIRGAVSKRARALRIQARAARGEATDSRQQQQRDPFAGTHCGKGSANAA